MRRWLFMIATLLSCVLLLCTLATWISFRYFNHRLSIRSSSDLTQNWLHATRAKLVLTRTVGNFTDTQDINIPQDAVPAFKKTNYPGSGYAMVIGLPYWMLSAVFALPPIVWLIFLRRRLPIGDSFCS